MDDSFIREGKTYIPSRRAAEISGYSLDYIGELCRSKKLECLMVGRSWYVTQKSLSAHKSSVALAEESRFRLINLYGKNPPDISSSPRLKKSRKAAALLSALIVLLFFFLGRQR
jgi:hypothetical protein